jgi:hypothetical protein
LGWVAALVTAVALVGLLGGTGSPLLQQGGYVGLGLAAALWIAAVVMGGSREERRATRYRDHVDRGDIACAQCGGAGRTTQVRTRRRGQREVVKRVRCRTCGGMGWFHDRR